MARPVDDIETGEGNMRQGGRYEVDPKTGDAVRVEGTQPAPAPWEQPQPQPRQPQPQPPRGKRNEEKP